MLKWRLSAGLVGLLLCSGASFAGVLKTELASWSVSDPFPVHAYLSGKPRSLSAGTRAWTRNRFLASYQRGMVSIGYIQRYDYNLAFSQQTAEFYWRERNDRFAEGTQSFALFLRGEHFRGQGARIGIETDSQQSLFGGLWVSFLDGMAVQDLAIDGAITHSDGRFTGNAEMDYHFSKDQILKDRAVKARGGAEALDLMLGWRDGSSQARLEVQDLWSQVRWHDISHTVGVLETENRELDEVARAALFSGRKGVADLNGRFPRLVRFSGSEQFAAWRGELEMVYFHGRLHVQPGASFVAPGGRYSLGYEWRTGLLALGLDSPGERFSLRLGADDPEFHKAHAVLLNLSFRQPW